MSNIERVFYSRESRVAEKLESEDVYPTHDEDTIYNAMSVLSESVDDLKFALDDQYVAYDELIEESTHNFDKMISARKEIVRHWAITQYTLSSLAYLLNIDGDKAFLRLHEALKKNEESDMEGL